MPTTTLLPAAAATPPMSPVTAIVAVGCLLGATLAIGVAAVAAPRTRVHPAHATGMFAIDARIVAPDGAVVSSPRFYALGGEPATFSTGNDGDRIALTVTATPSTRGDVVLAVDARHTIGATTTTRIAEAQRVHRGAPATFTAADGTKVTITPRFERRAAAR